MPDFTLDHLRAMARDWGPHERILFSMLVSGPCDTTQLRLGLYGEDWCKGGRVNTFNVLTHNLRRRLRRYGWTLSCTRDTHRTYEYSLTRIPQS